MSKRILLVCKCVLAVIVFAVVTALLIPQPWSMIANGLFGVVIANVALA